MKKVLTSFISIVILATNVLPISPFADNMNNEIGITNASDDYFYSDNDYQCSLNNDNTINIEFYVGSDTYVDIPSYIDNKLVTSIGMGAFEDCSSLTSIMIPNSVTSIGEHAFQYCSNLTNVTIPNSVTSIENFAFSDCSSLTGITIPNGVTSIGNYAFAGCSITNLTIPDSVTSIGEGAFYGCSNLTNITIPSGVTSIGEHAFQYCSNLTNVTIPNGVTSIGNFAFSDCSSLTGITIPNGVTSIGNYAFAGCSITNLTIPDSVTSIGSKAFSDCSSLTNITIPSGVTSIENKTFSGCSNLTSITIPDSVTSIGEYAFEDCSNLISIIIPDSVTCIEERAFEDCSNLTSITIPDSVTSIGEGAFTWTGLTDIYYYGSKEEWENLIYDYSNYFDSITIHYYSNPNHTHTFTIEMHTSCWSSGTKTYVCECGYEYTEEIPQLEHHYVSILIKPTYLEQGYTLHTCSFCGANYKDNYITKLQLSAATGFRVTTTTANNVKLTWNKVKDADGYIVYKYDTSKKSWVRVAKTKSNSYTVNKLKSGTSYKFAVKAYKTVNGKEVTSSKFPTVTAITKLPTVTGFKTSSVSSTAVKLTWNKASGAQGYIVYKYDNSKKTWVRAAKTKTTANTYTVSKLKSGTSYKFAVKAYKTVNGKEVTSDAFPTLTTITKTPTVTGFKTSSASSSSVKLRWNKTSSVTGYIVYKYDTSKKSWVRVAKTKSNSYTVNKLKSGTSYKFAVKAYKTVNGKEVTSSKFPTVTAITKLPTVVNGAKTVGRNSVKLTWKKTTGAQGYIVYKYNNSKKTWVRVAKTKSLSYTVKKLKANTNYKFAVKAYKYINKKEITSVSFTPISVRTAVAQKPTSVITNSSSYLSNPESMIIHIYGCRTIKNINNYIATNDLQGALNSGYRKCKVCF